MSHKFSVKAILFVLFAIGSAISSSMVSARTLNDIDAVHKSAWQRTLALRIAKAHLQMAANVDYLSASNQLSSSIEEYSKALAELQLNAPSSQINQRIIETQAVWQRFRETAEATPSATSVVAVMELSDDLMYENDRLMRLWQARLPAQFGTEMEQALEQSMLSERIGVLYTAHYYGINDEWVQKELQYTVKAYEKGMQTITSKSDIEKDTLNQLVSNWEYAKFGLEQFNNEKLIPVVMAVTVESMYHQTNSLGEGYLQRARVAFNDAKGITDTGLAVNYSE